MLSQEYEGLLSENVEGLFSCKLSQMKVAAFFWDKIQDKQINSYNFPRAYFLNFHWVQRMVRHDLNF